MVSPTEGGATPNQDVGRPVRGRRPRLSTRLLVPLIGTVAAIMAAYGAWTLIGRERALRADSEREASAYATALGIALEFALADRDPSDARRVLERISLEPKIYGVIVYGPDARALYVTPPVTTSDALSRAEVAPVLRAGRQETFDRLVHGARVLSILRPIRGNGGGILGAFETIHPLAAAEAEVQRTRLKLLLTTAALIAALFLVIQWFVRRVVRRPLEHFVQAARALREGDLSHRMAGGASREIAALSDEFNTMAEHLQRTRDALVREADERVILERRLRETEKLATIGQLAAGLAHEIGTPLNVVAGRAEMLLRREEDPDRQGKLRIIIDQIGRITRTVRSLLDFARRREPHFEVTDVAGVLDTVIELVDGEAARARIRLEREGIGPAVAVVDPHLIHELVLNLVLNAIHALEACEGDRRVIVRLRTGGVDEGVVIEVEDNGPGIEASAMPHLFEPFYTTKAGSGTGLGLPVARAIAEEHGGTVEALNVSSDRAGAGTAADERQSGALFRVTLPGGRMEEAHG